MITGAYTEIFSFWVQQIVAPGKVRRKKIRRKNRKAAPRKAKATFQLFSSEGRKKLKIASIARIPVSPQQNQ